MYPLYLHLFQCPNCASNKQNNPKVKKKKKKSAFLEALLLKVIETNFNALNFNKWSEINFKVRNYPTLYPLLANVYHTRSACFRTCNTEASLEESSYSVVRKLRIANKKPFSSKVRETTKQHSTSKYSSVMCYFSILLRLQNIFVEL